MSEGVNFKASGQFLLLIIKKRVKCLDLFGNKIDLWTYMTKLEKNCSISLALNNNTYDLIVIA